MLNRNIAIIMVRVDATIFEFLERKKLFLLECDLDKASDMHFGVQQIWFMCVQKCGVPLSLFLSRCFALGAVQGSAAW